MSDSTKFIHNSKNSVGMTGTGRFMIQMINDHFHIELQKCQWEHEFVVKLVGQDNMWITFSEES